MPRRILGGLGQTVDGDRLAWGMGAVADGAEFGTRIGNAHVGTKHKVQKQPVGCSARILRDGMAICDVISITLTVSDGPRFGFPAHFSGARKLQI